MAAPVERSTAPRPTTDPAHELRVVDDAPRAGAASAGAVGVIAFVLIFGALFGMVVFQTLLIQGQLRVDQLNDAIGAEQDHIQELRLEVAEMEAPGRVLAAAHSRFGMIQPVTRSALDPVVPGLPGDVLATPGADPFGLIEHGSVAAEATGRSDPGAP